MKKSINKYKSKKTKTEPSKLENPEYLYANGGFLKNTGDFLANMGRADADVALSALGMNNVIPDDAYSGTGSKFARGSANIFGGMTKAILPMAANMIAPGSGMAVGAIQQGLGSFNPPANTQGQQGQQAHQNGQQMGNMAMQGMQLAQMYGNMNQGQSQGATPEVTPTTERLGGLFYRGGGIQNFYPNGGQANAQIEKQENFITPQGDFGQADGPSHEQGGIDLNIPQGTVIFSDKLKPQGSKKTFAILNKKNNTTKEDGILEDNKATSESKKSAQLMLTIKKMNSMKLFQAQEDLKNLKLDNYKKRLGGIQKYPGGGITGPINGVNNPNLVNDPSLQSSYQLNSDPNYQAYVSRYSGRGFTRDPNFPDNFSNGTQMVKYDPNKTFTNTGVPSPTAKYMNGSVPNPNYVMHRDGGVVPKFETRDNGQILRSGYNDAIYNQFYNLPNPIPQTNLSNFKDRQKIYGSKAELNKFYKEAQNQQQFGGGGTYDWNGNQSSYIENGTNGDGNNGMSYMNVPDANLDTARLQAEYRNQQDRQAYSNSQTDTSDQFKPMNVPDANYNFGSPKTPQGSPDQFNPNWKDAAYFGATTLAQSAGPLAYLHDQGKRYDTQQFHRYNPSQLDPRSALRDADMQANASNNSLVGASGGNAGNYMANRVALASNNTMDKFGIRSQYDNANAQINNQAGIYNNQNQYMVDDRNQANKDAAKRAYYAAIDRVGNNTSNGMRDMRGDKYDQQGYNSLSELYKNPEFVKWLATQKKI